jgi:hypothetical protein
MTFPPSWTQVPITATYYRRDSQPARGTVVFESPQIEGLPGGVVLATRIVGQLVAGVLSVVLPATDDPVIAVRGWAYRVTELIEGGQTPYYITVPFDAGSINLNTWPHAEAMNAQFTPYLREVDIDVKVPSMAAIAAVNTLATAAQLGEQAAIDAANAALALARTVQAAQAAGAIGFVSVAAMNADLHHAAGTLAFVTNDGTVANDGLYIKLGAVDAGSWQQSADRTTTLASQLAADEVVLTAASVRALNIGARSAAPAGTVYPLMVDYQLRVLLGYDTAARSVVGDGVVTSANVQGYINPSLPPKYSGSPSLYPMFSDYQLRPLLAYDVSKGRLVGSGLTWPQAAALTPLTGADLPVARAINHILAYGQSLSMGGWAVTAISTTQPYSNVTFNGGPRAWTGSAYDFTAFKPLVEDAVVPTPDGSSENGETLCSGAANFAVTLNVAAGAQPADHIILASAAGHGGYAISQLAKGSAWYTSSLLPHISGAKALNASYALQVVAWEQGEQDGAAGTTYAAYRAALNQLQIDVETDAKAISGQSGPVYFLTYQLSPYITSNPHVAEAQLNLAQTNNRFVLVSPTYIFPRNTSSNLHFSAVGYKWFGAYVGRAYQQLVIKGTKPKWLNPVSATLRGNTVRARYDVPTLPLAIDTSIVSAVTGYGFRVVDTIGTVVINSVDIDGTDVILNLATTPVGASTLRYGYDYLALNQVSVSMAAGNLRDSAVETITIQGTVYPLYNFAPHSILNIVPVGE